MSSFNVTSIEGTDDNATVTIEQVAVTVPKVEQLYRWTENDTSPILTALILEGVLVPVEPCIHGKIDRHQLFGGSHPASAFDDHGRAWCEGAGLGGDV